MHYLKTVRAKFISRPNRFIAQVEFEGVEETVHVKNTGRCKELLVPGCTVILEDFREEAAAGKRKTRFDIIAVYKGNLLINMDSQAPNKVVKEWLQKQQFDLIHPEFTYGNSRVDFYMEKKLPSEVEGGQTSTAKYLLEVKGCTLEVNGTGYFPDAPTERGVKHLRELTEAQKLGYHCYIAFVIQIPGVSVVLPNIKTHPEFGTALVEAEAAGVKILYLQCEVQEAALEIINPKNF